MLVSSSAVGRAAGSRRVLRRFEPPGDRRVSRISQPHRARANRSPSPGCGSGGRTWTSNRARRGRQLPSGSAARLPRRTRGTTGTCACAAARKAPQVERQQAGGSPEGPFGEHHQCVSAPCMRRQRLRVLHRAAQVEALDEASAEPAQEGAGDALLPQFGLGDEVARPRQDRHQHDPVEVTAMVAHDHARPRRDVLQSLDPRRHAGEREECARGRTADGPGACGIGLSDRQQPGGRREKSEQRGRIPREQQAAPRRRGRAAVEAKPRRLPAAAVAGVRAQGRDGRPRARTVPCTQSAGSCRWRS